MKNIIAAFLLILTLAACAHRPDPRTLPSQFLGYWPPLPDAPKDSIGVNIHADGRLSHVRDLDGKIIGRLEYKFICSPNPGTAFIFVRGTTTPSSRSNIGYYNLNLSEAAIFDDRKEHFLDVTATFYMDPLPSLKEWNYPATDCKRLYDMWYSKEAQYNMESVGHYYKASQ